MQVATKREKTVHKNKKYTNIIWLKFFCTCILSTTIKQLNVEVLCNSDYKAQQGRIIPLEINGFCSHGSDV